MGWLSRFRKRLGQTEHSADTETSTRQAIDILQVHLDRLGGRIETIDIAIKGHNDRLDAHERRLDDHARRFQTLEKKLATPTVERMTFARPSLGYSDRARIPLPAAHSNRSQQFDIEQFTEQQKHVLACFFQHKGRAMSYADVARLLNKSAYTIKNHVNRIRQKADLFDCTIGPQSRNLFTLKDDLRVEKYLKVGRPMQRHLSSEETESPETEAEPVVECAYARSRTDNGNGNGPEKDDENTPGDD
jgi:DNA-binding CsgD family transcriptional regulator